MARIAPKPSPVSSAFEKAIAGRMKGSEGPSPQTPRSQYIDPRGVAAKVAALASIPGIKKGQNIQGSYRVERPNSVSPPRPAAPKTPSGKAEVVFTPRGNTNVARNAKTGRPLPVKGK